MPNQKFENLSSYLVYFNTHQSLANRELQLSAVFNLSSFANRSVIFIIYKHAFTYFFLAKWQAVRFWWVLTHTVIPLTSKVWPRDAHFMPAGILIPFGRGFGVPARMLEYSWLLNVFFNCPIIFHTVVISPFGPVGVADATQLQSFP
jgi:hypothetical protein